MIRRYHFVQDISLGCDCRVGMEESDNGEWVKWEDVIKYFQLEAKNLDEVYAPVDWVSRHELLNLFEEDK
jgi:hypothetical protein